MKTNTLLAKAAMMLTMAVGLALSACSNEPGLKTAVGDYDYRIAGTARIYFADSNEESFVTLTPESGTMTVTRSKESDKCNVTLYADDGNTYEMVLFFTHDTVWIDNPIFRDIIVKIDDKDELFNIRISGEGQVLNNGDLNMQLGYSGRSRNSDHNWTLTANPVSVHLNARKR